MNRPPRVAFFSDCFHEINGVALTSRQFDAFARRRELPFFSVHTGPETALRIEGAVTTLELARSSASFGVDADLKFDTLFFRRLRGVRAALRPFRPDLVHVTSPGDIGILGALVAHQLRVPMTASWHTNLHEFGARRLAQMLSWLPGGVRERVSRTAENAILAATVRFYKIAKTLFAPNQELVRMLRTRSGRPVHLMTRGVDTALFHPCRRDRADSTLTLGYVGRITPEKNVRLLAGVEQALLAAGLTDFRIVVVGQGSERPWLEANLQHVHCTGPLQGEALARAYANLDLFLFPSHTDTFGNVIQEALASGVPAVVTASGGPKFLVEPGETGLVAENDSAFCAAVAGLAKNPERLAAMRALALQRSPRASWDAVFERVYSAYGELPEMVRARQSAPSRSAGLGAGLSPAGPPQRS